MAEVLMERIEQGGVAWAEITLNRPEKGNALTIPMLRQLDAFARELEADRSVRVVLLRGRGRFFCTGGDIEAWGALGPHEMARDWILPGIDAFARIAALPQPVVAVLSGHTLGGGLELALAADLRIAVRSAKLGTPEVTIGMIPGWMGVSRLAETIGLARARHFTLLGSPVTAAQSLDWGLVTAIAEDLEDLEKQTASWREKLSANGPAAMSLVKGILSGFHADLRQHHAAAVAEASGTADCREGVRAFLDKRKPEYRNQ